MNRWRPSAEMLYKARPEALGLTDTADPKFVLSVYWGRWILGALTAISCYGTFVRGAGDYSYFWDGMVYLPLEIVATYLSVARAKVAHGRERISWSLYAVSLGLGVLNSGARFVYHLIGAELPFPFVGDYAILINFLTMYGALIMLMRNRIKQMPRSVWLDGIVGASACAAVALAVEYDAIVRGASGGTWAQNAVNLAFPVFDLILLALIVGCFALSSWRPDRVWLCVAAGQLTNAVADGLSISWTGYVPGTPIDMAWTVAWLFLGLAPWQPVKHVERQGSERWSIVVLPFVFSTSSIVVLVLGTIRPIAHLTVMFAVVALTGGMIRLSLTFREIRTLNQTRKEARTDELTELGNRRYFYEKATELLNQRTHDQPLALLVIDLDRFKEINDSLGHQVGDGLLRQLGPRLKNALGREAIVARLGGDEFAVILDGATGSYALKLADKVITSLDEPFVLEGVPVGISASIGISLFPQHASEPNGLLQHADVAMYSSKRERSGPQIYLPERDSHSKERLRSIHELRRMIERGALAVHYQPQVNARTGSLTGVEALVRLYHPTRGMVPPDHFLPLAEQAGLMRLLTDKVVDLVLDDLVKWRDAGAPPVKVAINLSVTNLLDIQFPDDIQRKLTERYLSARNIVFEVTESTMLSDAVRAQFAVERLRSMGAEIALDDYGTGYASLGYLRKFPLDELKLDKSFVDKLDTDSVARTFVNSTIEIAHALGLRVVAEGIETDAIWRAVRAAGANVCQGYLFSKPLPADVFFEKLLAWAESSRQTQKDDSSGYVRQREVDGVHNSTRR